MLEQQGVDTWPPRRPRPSLRTRKTLEVVSAADATGIIVQCNPNVFRGGAGIDYACGDCGSILCIGVAPGTFRSLTFECGCGALNQVR